MGDLQKIDTFADKKLNPVDVVITDKHFFDRLNDPRNGRKSHQQNSLDSSRDYQRRRRNSLTS